MLETEQIRLLLFRHGFKNVESGRRKTQERLLALYRREKVHRWAADAPLTKPAYIYSLEAKKGRDAHRLDVNWVRLWFTLPARRWRYHKVYNFHYEQDFGFLRADGLVGLNNYVTKKNLFFFVEMDRSPRNVFDKVPKYTRLMEEKGYGDRWWVRLTDSFPDVLVVTTSEARKKEIELVIQEQNKAGLVFEVRLLDDIKREVLTS